MACKDAVRRLRRRVAQLRRHFPINGRVIVRVYDFGTLRDDEGHRLFGRCWKSAKCFIIEIELAEDVSVSIDTLWHEYAHVMVWPDTEHSQRFFAQYGRIYKHYQG